MPRFPSAQGRLNHEPDSTLAVTKTCPKDGVHLWIHEQFPPDVPSYVPRTDVEKGLALQPGGGVDIHLAERVALRLKADFMNVGNLRLAAGVAFGVGDRGAR